MSGRKSPPKFCIQRTGGNSYVLRDGVEVAGPYHDHYIAEDRMATLERRARHTERRCMTCSDPFISEGMHNRMCNSCRAHRSEFVAV